MMASVIQRQHRLFAINGRGRACTRCWAACSELVIYHHHTRNSAAMENELVRIWQLVNELSEQLAHNQKMAGTLHSQMHTLKVRVEIAARGVCTVLKQRSG
jgi:hypothetical protein